MASIWKDSSALADVSLVSILALMFLVCTSLVHYNQSIAAHGHPILSFRPGSSVKKNDPK